MNLLKKIILLLVLSPVIIVFIFWIALMVGHWIFDRGEQTNKEFLKTLKGEVVYRSPAVRGDIKHYKISATGNNKVLISDSEANKYNQEFMDRFLYSGNGDQCNFGKKELLSVQERSANGRGKGLVVKGPDLYFINEKGEEKLLYKYPPRSFWHDNIWYPVEGVWHNGGAQDASWSPDKNYVIFMLNEGGSNEIMIVNKEGTQLAKLANGRAPMWKDSFNTPYTMHETPTLANAPTATTSFFGVNSGYMYTICGTATPSVGKSIYIRIDKEGGGYSDNFSTDIQLDRTWSWKKPGLPAGKYQVILRKWNTDLLPNYPLGPIILTGTLISTGTTAP